MTYDAENRVATWNTLPVTHDDDGNLTSGPLPAATPGLPSPGFGTYVFDARNRLSTLNSQLSTTSYTYDAENLRTRVTTAAGNTQWVINPAGSPPQPLVRTGPGGTVTRYVWGLGLLYEVADGDTQPTKTYHYDRRGSTVALSHADGLTVTDRWAYGPYGERLSHTGTNDTPFQFNGFFGVQTDANGLLYMNARYYNTELRRFVSADPTGFAAGSNFYAFADGDPIDLADPFGLCATDTSSSGFARLGGMKGDPCIMCHGVSAGGFNGDPNSFSSYLPGSGPNARAGYAALAHVSSMGYDSPEGVVINTAVGAALTFVPGLIAAKTTSLFRAVGPAEFEQLMATKTFQAGSNSLGGKFFAETAEHAAQWGTKMEGAGNFRIIEAKFPKGTADSFMRWERLDGIGPARYGELGPAIAAKPTILPWP